MILLSSRPYSGDVADGARVPLSLEHITFSHKGGNKPILRGVSLTLHHGEVMAITGQSDAGNRHW